MVVAVIWRHLINKILFWLNSIKQHHPPLVSFVAGGSEGIDDINGIAVLPVTRWDTFTSEMLARNSLTFNLHRNTSEVQEYV